MYSNIFYHFTQLNMIYFFRSPLFCFNFCMSNTNKVDYCHVDCFLLSCRLEQRETETSHPYKKVDCKRSLHYGLREGEMTKWSNGMTRWSNGMTKWFNDVISTGALAERRDLNLIKLSFRLKRSGTERSQPLVTSCF